jgi:hypothetical protein
MHNKLRLDVFVVQWWHKLVGIHEKIHCVESKGFNIRYERQTISNLAGGEAFSNVRNVEGQMAAAETTSRLPHCKVYAVYFLGI